MLVYLIWKLWDVLMFVLEFLTVVWRVDRVFCGSYGSLYIPNSGSFTHVQESGISGSRIWLRLLGWISGPMFDIDVRMGLPAVFGHIYCAVILLADSFTILSALDSNTWISIWIVGNCGRFLCLYSSSSLESSWRGHKRFCVSYGSVSSYYIRNGGSFTCVWDLDINGLFSVKLFSLLVIGKKGSLQNISLCLRDQYKL